jgi:hypothetical protein
MTEDAPESEVPYPASLHWRTVRLIEACAELRTLLRGDNKVYSPEQRRAITDKICQLVEEILADPNNVHRVAILVPMMRPGIFLRMIGVT